MVSKIHFPPSITLEKMLSQELNIIVQIGRISRLEMAKIKLSTRVNSIITKNKNSTKTRIETYLLTNTNSVLSKLEMLNQLISVNLIPCQLKIKITHYQCYPKVREEMKVKALKYLRCRS